MCVSGHLHEWPNDNAMDYRGLSSRISEPKIPSRHGVVVLPATLRQLYSVVSVMPVSPRQLRTDRLCGGIIRLKTDCFGSSEYLDISRHFPPPLSLKRLQKTVQLFWRGGRVIQLLLEHTKLESTVRYLGIEVDDALEMAEQTEI